MYSFIAAVLCAEGSNGVVRKYWVRDSNNWNNPKNWDVSPDRCDPVILSDRGKSNVRIGPV
jgi:hypothetical protein